MKPEDTLKKVTDYLKNLEKAKRLHIAVGLPKGEATSKIYGNGNTVVDIGTIHEFGLGNPKRSFLNTPFRINKEKITKNLALLFKQIVENGASAENQLEKAGVFLQNISKESFENKGFGTWPDITEATIKAKTVRGKRGDAILIDNGILRGSITYEVR